MCYVNFDGKKTHTASLTLMPPKATWDDLMHDIYVREAIERGLADSNAGRSKEVQEVRAK